MYISLDWIKDFVKISTKTSPEKIAEELTGHTVEVEEVLRQSDLFQGVLVGEVLSVELHPNADRLNLAIVDIKTEKLNIVCGASNLKVGQMVPVATIGTNLPNGLEIRQAEIRGESSCGMICAEDELGLGNDHEGIMVLDKKAKVGQSFAQYLGNKDSVLEIDNKSLSNRPDLLGHYGMAREISAIFGFSLKPYEKLFLNNIKFPEEKGGLEVKVEDKNLCPRYIAIKISGIEIKESPQWLQERLIAVNQRLTNNIVDLTNYVMLESGQPLHAFAADKVDKIIVRQAKKEEKIESLDGKERILNEDDLVIADSKKPIAIAGVIGGSNSEVDKSSTEIILESANFVASSIRKTSQKLGLRTEASTRFEKSLDSTLCEQAVMRFLTLLKEVCPKYSISSELIDLNNVVEEKKVIELDLNWVNNKIGQDIPKNEVLKILEKLGFIVEEKNKKTLLVEVPSWRATKDVSIKEDLVEEILRLYGYDKVISQVPKVEMLLPEPNKLRELERRTKNVLALKYKLNESYNYSFLGEDHLKKLRIDFSTHLRLANPLSGIQSILRKSLAPGLIGNIKSNQMKAEEFGFFEIGRIYLDAPSNFPKNKEKEEEVLPYQGYHLGLVLAGKNKKVFSDLKSIINNLFQTLINHEMETEFSFSDNKPSWADSKMSAKIFVAGEELGAVSLLDQELAQGMNLKKEVAVAELNFNDILELILNRAGVKFKEPSKYPALIRDLAFVVDKEVLYNDLRKDILTFDPLIKSVELFDVYEGSKLTGNQKSLAFHLYYQSEEKTLTSDEVDKIQNELVEKLAQKFAAQLRDF